MLHCGWRGLAAGIVARGADAVEATDAAIGPGIGPCCYEVGPEVLDAFADLGEGIADGRMLDLPEVARRLLARAGVEQVESAGLCTSCEAELFFSHRRDAGAPAARATSPGSRTVGGLSAAHPLPRHRPGPGPRQPRGGRATPPARRPRSSSPASTCRWRRWGRWPRPGCRWSARTASRTSPPSTSARATTSPGTSSATCRAARSSRSCPWCG